MGKKKIVYQEVYVDIKNVGGREAVHQQWMDLLGKEIAGSRVNGTPYRYYTNQLSNGSWVYLDGIGKKNAIDELVLVDGYTFVTDRGKPTSRVAFSFLTQDLQNKHKESAIEYGKLLELLRIIFECKRELTVDDFNSVHFTTGLPVEALCLLIQNLFITEDLNYWRDHGRYKTWAEAIPDKYGMVHSDIKKYPKKYIADGTYTFTQPAYKKYEAINATVVIEGWRWILKKGSVVGTITRSLGKRVSNIRNQLIFDEHGVVLEDIVLGECVPREIATAIAGRKLKTEPVWIGANGQPAPIKEFQLYDYI